MRRKQFSEAGYQRGDDLHRDQRRDWQSNRGRHLDLYLGEGTSAQEDEQDWHYSGIQI